jgi:hypothetical protein
MNIQKMISPTVLATFTALFDDIVNGLARYGLGMVGIPYPDDKISP